MQSVCAVFVLAACHKQGETPPKRLSDANAWLTQVRMTKLKFILVCK